MAFLLTLLSGLGNAVPALPDERVSVRMDVLFVVPDILCVKACWRTHPWQFLDPVHGSPFAMRTLVNIEAHQPFDPLLGGFFCPVFDLHLRICLFL